jgi:hypothetical protein
MPDGTFVVNNINQNTPCTMHVTLKITGGQNSTVMVNFAANSPEGMQAAHFVEIFPQGSGFRSILPVPLGEVLLTIEHALNMFDAASDLSDPHIASGIITDNFDQTKGVSGSIQIMKTIRGTVTDCIDCYNLRFSNKDL